MTFRPELLDELLKGYENPEDLLGETGILKQLTAALVERCLNAEMKTHLDERRSQPPSERITPSNRRNGHSKKTIKGEFGEAEIIVPRDRTSEFEPILVKKGQTRSWNQVPARVWTRGTASSKQEKVPKFTGRRQVHDHMAAPVYW